MATMFRASKSSSSEFVYALNLSRCIGCRKCVHACVEENNQSRSPELQYIRVLEMPRGTTDIEKGNHHYDRPTVPDDDHFYMPIQCHQCADAPCVKVCPVEATWTGVGRNHRHRLRLVHRLPVLRSRLPLLGAALQLHRARKSRPRAQPGHELSLQPPARERA